MSPERLRALAGKWQAEAAEKWTEASQPYGGAITPLQRAAAGQAARTLEECAAAVLACAEQMETPA
jgi:hypothetical protein